ncbi:MAG TPA: deoxyribodipyrimidine photo-lyase [Geminicoccaceae bacterium]|nr:deoxyribodipyrimidine photo-lyase [Geminicoccaceae bacterium]
MPPVLHWFRQDLRLGDNPALSAAVAGGGSVIPVFVLDEQTPGAWTPGAASRWWLHHSLAALGESLRQRGAPLVLRRGPALEVLPRLAKESGAGALFWTRCYEPYAARLEAALASTLAERGIECRRFGGNLLYEPEAIATADDQSFRVFTPFWRACSRRPEPKPPLAAPERIPAATEPPRSERLEDWQLLPVPDWAGGLRASWTPGEAGAKAHLTAFVDGALARYGKERDRVDLAATSRLSPHLHHGEISPRQCWHAASAVPGARAFLRELGWREFSYHLLHHFPTMPERSFRPEFEHFPWHSDRRLLERWQRGLTGFPIVDAGMRELWHTGWMHNRARMVTASFLTKHLLTPWQDGEAWFWDTLVDADLSNNAVSWQWVAGCGADAAPYFRIFNPVLQGQKFDPEGDYVRRWLPELTKLPTADLHAPWQASEPTLRDAGVRLGENYPRPIVDHREARRRALAAYEEVKEGRWDGASASSGNSLPAGAPALPKRR